MLGPGDFVEGERYTGIVKSFADHGATFPVHVGVFLPVCSISILSAVAGGNRPNADLPKDHDQLPLDITSSGKGIIVHAFAQTVFVDVGSEIAYGGSDSGV